MSVNYEELKMSYGEKLKNQPIVVIDSGIGGMSFTAKLLKEKPVENIIFFADNEFMPVGNKNEKILSRRMVKIISKIKKLEPKAVILACNTIDSVVGDKLQAQLGNYPFYRVVDLTAKEAVKVSKNNEIGLLATTNTIESQKYIYSMLSTSPHTHLIGVECPNLAYAIETGTNLKQVCNDEIAPLKEFDIDTLILGCTHYSSVLPIIKKAYSDVNIIDSSEVLMNNFISDLENKLQFNVANKGHLVVITTKNDDTFTSNLGKHLKDVEYDLLIEDEL